jgi:hypothetical protein
VAASELHRTIHDFAALSRFITLVGRAAILDHAQMDSQSRAFEATLEATPVGTPLPCRRIMIAQPIQPWTPARIAAALVMALVQAPAGLAPAAISRRRA